jgi:hypothetical protein
MTPAWKRFEQFVSRIEKALAPRGAVVKWNDSLPDKDTGKPRQVDVTIRYTIGATAVLIAFECRDRGDEQDVTWVEQLASKKDSIRADIMVAVSAEGFYEPAIVKASHLGIQLRTLTDQDADSMVEWLRVNDVVVKEIEQAFLGVRVTILNESDEDELDPSVHAELRRHGRKAKIFFPVSGGEPFSPEDILIKIEKRFGDLRPKELSDTNSPISAPYPVTMPEGGLQIATTCGLRDLRQIVIGLKWTQTKKLVPRSRLAEYANTDKPVVQAAEWDIDVGKTIGLYRNLESGETKVHFHTDKPMLCKFEAIPSPPAPNPASADNNSATPPPPHSP